MINTDLQLFLFLFWRDCRPCFMQSASSRHSRDCFRAFLLWDFTVIWLWIAGWLKKKMVLNLFEDIFFFFFFLSLLILLTYNVSVLRSALCCIWGIFYAFYFSLLFAVVISLCVLFQVGCGGNPERPKARSRESKGTWSLGMVRILFSVASH